MFVQKWPPAITCTLQSFTFCHCPKSEFLQHIIISHIPIKSKWVKIEIASNWKNFTPILQADLLINILLRKFTCKRFLWPLVKIFVLKNVIIKTKCASISKYLHFESIFVNAKIIILSYKINIFGFMKIVLVQRYFEMIVSY